jgi:hypothetical protein
MSARKLILRVIPSLCVLLGCVSFWSAPASATEVHVFKTTFAGPGSEPGQLDKPLGIAVNSSTDPLTEPAAGDVYVVDSANNRVERFSATGVYLGQFNGSGTFEVVEGGTPKVEHGTPAPTGAFSEPVEIAVDNSGDPVSDPSAGDVYVIDRGHGVIDKFSATGAFLGQLTGAGTPGGLFEAGEPGVRPRAIAGVAVDPSGTVWVSVNEGSIYSFTDELNNKYSGHRSETDFEPNEGLAVDSEDNLYLKAGSRDLAKVNSAGKTLIHPFGEDEAAWGVAVDPVAGEVYLDNLTSIEAFGLDGKPIEGSATEAPFPSFGSGRLAESFDVAVNTDTSTVYATNHSAGTVSVFEALFLPSVNIGAVSAQGPRGVTLNGSVSPEGKPVSLCEFEYASAEEYEATKTYGHKEPCSPGSLGEGKAPEPAVPVMAEIKGLTPGTTYHYRLVAENAAHFPSVTADQVLVAGPILGGESASEVTSSSVTLRASLDPNGGDTHYYFEYGTSPSYGSFAPVSPPGVDLSPGVGAQPVSVHLQGLAAGTAYHYRFVAVQDGEAFEDPDHGFTTQTVGGSAGLLDGRAWELVSPADKHGAQIEPPEQGGQVQAATDGSGITYMTEAGSVNENPQGKFKRAQVLSRRGPDGWSTEDLTLPGRLPENGESAEHLFAGGGFNEYHLFSPDLSSAAVEPQAFGTPPLAPGVTERTLYLRDDSDGSFTPLVSPADVPPGTKIEESNFDGVVDSYWEMHFLAATPDLAHVVFTTPMALTPEAIKEESVQEKVQENKAEIANVQSNLYEWSAGKLQLVNILPETDEHEFAHAPDEVAHGRSRTTTPPVRLAGDESSGGLPAGGAPRSVSADGRRVAWAFGEPLNGNVGFRGLYVRDMVEERTVHVGGDAVYQTMNSEGSKIFYLDGGDLYVYDFETEKSTDLTADHGASEPNGGVQETVSDISENGSYVYFVATSVLASGGVSGKDNLYVLHETGEGWSTTRIATLSGADRPSWYGEGDASDRALGHVSSRISPDGHFLVFMSEESLTGYDNTDANSGAPDEEVYSYNAQTNKLVCTSCDPTGARSTGVFDSTGELLVDPYGAWEHHAYGSGAVDHWLAGSVPGWDFSQDEPSTYQPRYLSDSGRTFFDSPVALVPGDTNGLEDVYEFEPVGVSGCSPATSSSDAVYVPSSEGCVGLISSGTSSSESVFYDASENGDDVFFDTTSRLAPEDFDKAYDLYDAHLCGGEGVPCRTTPVASPPCEEGESCKAAPSPQPPIFGAPPSATFNGAGNITPTVAKVVPEPKAKPLTRAQKLAKALKVCKEKAKGKRASCEKAARKAYGPVKAKQKGRK